MTKRRFRGAKMFYDMLEDTGLPEEEFSKDQVLEFFTPTSKKYDDVTFDFWRTKKGWFGISSSQEASIVHFKSRPTVARYLRFAEYGTGRLIREKSIIRKGLRLQRGYSKAAGRVSPHFSGREARSLSNQSGSQSL